MSVSSIALSHFRPDQLQTIRQTVAKDTNDTEFNLFMEAARSYGLDPFRKQINAVVYNKDKPDKRKMSIITSRDGLRVIASRCKDYRPASEPPTIELDDALISKTNPKGIVSATVYLWKQDNSGNWYKVVGQADWDEFAALKEIWDYDKEDNRRKPTGRFELDSTSTWAKMPKLMLTKCAESQALRAGWPEQFGGLYSEDEMHGVSFAESASDQLEEFQKMERQKRVGGPSIFFVWDDTFKTDRVEIGAIYDRVAEFIRTSDADEIYKFQVRNEESLKEFWVHDKSGALELRKLFDAAPKPVGEET